MTVNPAMPSFSGGRTDPVAESEVLGLTIQSNLRGLGYGE